MELWDDKRSNLTPTTADSGRYTGFLMLHELEFRFSLNRKSTAKHLYRGTISAISPEDGKVLKYETQNAGQKSTTAVSAEVYCNSGSLDAIQSAITEAALRLYANHTPTIYRAQYGASRPETITPALAAHLYGENYINISHSSSSTERKKAIYNKLLKCYTAMPPIAMSQFSMKKMSAFLKGHAFGKKILRDLAGFWDYCIAKGHCTGGSPFQLLQKRRISAKAHKNRAMSASVLSEQTQDALFAKALTHPDGPTISAVLQLWAGLDPKEIETLRWKDILFDEAEPDYVRVVLYHPDTAGYTHIYTRPVFPQAARILWLRREQIKSEFRTENALQNAPVASTLSDIRVPLKSEDIVKRSSTLLRDCGVLEETFAHLKEPGMAVSRRLFKNTYRSNLIQKCGLADDPYTVKFLCGESLSGDTSSDHYISFTDEDASYHLYTLMHILAPEKRYDTAPITQQDEKGKTVEYTINPYSSRHCAAVECRLVLMPGETFMMECTHGVTGDVVIREIEEDGKPKRLKASPKTSVPQES